ncbi:hypothetical protein [Agromyces bauzanensis]
MSLIATVVELSTTLAPTVDPTASIIRTSLTDEAIAQSEQWTAAIKAVAGVGLTLFAVILMITSRGKIGRIISGLAVLGLASWIVFGSGSSWFATKVNEQFNGAPISYSVVEEL